MCRISASSLMSYGFLFAAQVSFLEWSRNTLIFDNHLSFLNVRKEAEYIERQLVEILHTSENKSLSRLVFKAIPIYVLFCWFLLPFVFCAFC
jgi:sensor histidine kinase YesM